MALSAEAAIVIVLAQAIVLFIFSSSSLSGFLMNIGLPPIPLVPVSSSQVVVGAILGIGLVKGANEIKFKTVRGIVGGWILTPVLAGLLSFFSLFFVKNIFNLNVGSEITRGTITPEISSPMTDTIPEIGRYINFIWPGISIMVILVFSAVVVYSFNQQKRRLAAEKELLDKEKEYNNAQRALTEAEIKSMHLENSFLHNEIENRRKELVDYALGIVEQKEFFEKISADLKALIEEKKPEARDERIRKMDVDIRQRMSFTDKVDDFNLQTEKMNKDFTERMHQLFPMLTPNDLKLAVLLRLGISSKEIATLFNISPKSVEINRYRLRKKLGLGKGANLTQFINNI